MSDEQNPAEETQPILPAAERPAPSPWAPPEPGQQPLRPPAGAPDEQSPVSGSATHPAGDMAAGAASDSPSPAEAEPADGPASAQPPPPTGQPVRLDGPGPSGPLHRATPEPTLQLPSIPARTRDGRRGWGAVAGIALLALVIGLVGGIAGSAIYRSAVTSNGEVPSGLSGVDLAPLPPLKNGGSVAAVAAAVLPSTVQIVAEYDGAADGATGSGFVLDKQGHIVTNNHVVKQADDDNGPITVVYQGDKRYKATVVGRSTVYDLAVLYVKNAPKVKPASLGSSKAMRVGDPVVAIGSPLGLDATVTSGIISALDRPVTTSESQNPADQSFIDAIQTDAAINPGNSGGPLVDLHGQVVGVNSAIATNGGGTTSGTAGNIGVGFAIPVEQVRVTVDEILRSGKAEYPIIGADLYPSDQTDGEGAKLKSITPGSPAADAGLKADDVVTAIDGKPVPDGVSLIVAIRTHQPGDTIHVTYKRGGDAHTVAIRLASKVDQAD